MSEQTRVIPGPNPDRNLERTLALGSYLERALGDRPKLVVEGVLRRTVGLAMEAEGCHATLGVESMLGRPFTPDEVVVGAAPAVVMRNCSRMLMRRRGKKGMPRASRPASKISPPEPRAMMSYCGH